VWLLAGFLAFATVVTTAWLSWDLGDTHRTWALMMAGFLAVAAESFLPVLPLGPLVAVNVLVLGSVEGFLISWLGAILGSSAGYWTARGLGGAVLMRRMPVAYRERVERVASSTRFRDLLVAWLVPGVNCVVSCAAGVARVPFPVFLLSCATGLLPWVGIYAFLAHDLAHAGALGSVVALLGAAALLWCLVGKARAYVRRRCSLDVG
jgi:uncharacterized membrane protein YdjX (TVP38/TMEM64 family)